MNRGILAAGVHADMCNDNANGYSWAPRWGEDGLGIKTIVVSGHRCSYERGSYECGTSVTTAWKSALKGTPWEHSLDSYVYSGNAKEVYLSTGLFEWKPMSFIAQPGDVYLNIQNHVAMCQPPGTYNGRYYDDPLSEFCINESGGVYGGQVGDQTGTEAYIHAYYDYPWDGILHYNGKADGASSGSSSSSSGSQKPAAAKNPEKVTWRVRQNGKWQKEGHKGTRGKPITALAVNMHGHGWYQVATAAHGWLDPVRGYNVNDDENGYAGWQDSPVIAVRVYYETPDAAKTGWLCAKYRVSDVNCDWWPWQTDDDEGPTMDGYAGDYRMIDRFELELARC